MKKDKLTMGPVFFYWDQNKMKKFYKDIAQEPAIDDVYLGEVICSKRDGFEFSFWQEIIKSLQDAGKRVIFSTLALISNDYEIKTIKEIIEKNPDLPIEANDISTIVLLDGRVSNVGQLFNIYNEESLKFLAKKGIKEVTLPVETSLDALKILAQNKDLNLSVQVFGRMPLAISARCYHARAHNLSKINCEFSCAKDPNGLVVKTLEEKPFLAVNGLQTLSYKYCNLLNEIPKLKEIGINNFRLSPQDDVDMTKISQIFRNFIDEKVGLEEANKLLVEETKDNIFSNGFFYGDSGMNFIKNSNIE